MNQKEWLEFILSNNRPILSSGCEEKRKRTALYTHRQKREVENEDGKDMHKEGYQATQKKAINPTLLPPYLETYFALIVADAVGPFGPRHTRQHAQNSSCYQAKKDFHAKHITARETKQNLDSKPLSELYFYGETKLCQELGQRSHEGKEQIEEK